jgi:hypothetical protein
MDNSFNPYHVFLGLSGQLSSPNYYQILALPERESDSAAITAAADRATVRVRSQRPGQHAAQWSRLLDEIQAAKTCLLDPAKKSAYDAALAQPGQAEGAAPTGVQQPRPQRSGERAPNPAQPVASGARERPSAHAVAPSASEVAAFLPTSASPAQNPASAAQPATPAGNYLPPGYAVSPAVAWNPAQVADATAQPGPMLPVGPAGLPYGFAAPAMPSGPLYAAPPQPVQHHAFDPMAPVDYSLPASVPQAGMPMGGVLYGYAQPVVPTAHSAAIQDAAPQPAEALFVQPAVVRGRPLKRRSSKGPLLLATVCGFSLLVVGGTIAALNWDRIRPPVNDESLAMNPAAAPAPAVPAAPVPASAQPAANSAAPEGIAPQATEPPMAVETSAPTTEPVEPAMAVPPVKPANPTPEPATPEPARSPEPTTPESPASETPEMKAPSAEELQTLGKLMRGAKTSLGTFEFDEANAALAEAEALAVLPEHRAKVQRLQEVANQARQFHEAIGRTLATISAGDVIKVGTSTEAAVVDVNSSELVLRLNGQNRTYTIDDMPLGLAVNLGEKSLNAESPTTRVLKGAYVLVNKRTDAAQRQKAKTWWEEAQLNGVDMRELMPVFDDDYDFTSDTPKKGDETEPE